MILIFRALDQVPDPSLLPPVVRLPRVALAEDEGRPSAFALSRSHADEDFITPSASDSAVRFSEETRRAFDLESKADFVTRYSTDGKLDVGIGRTDKVQNLHHPIRFTLEELEGFFDDQKHKGLIVVIVAKHVWTDEELADHVTRLRDYFVDRGYQRVVIEQAYGSGRGIHLDHPEPKPAQQGAAGQSASPLRVGD